MPAAGIGGSSFRVGATLNRSFGVVVSGFGKFVAIQAMALAPSLLLSLLAAQAAPETRAVLIGTAWIAQFLLGSLASAMCLLGAYEILHDRPFSVAESFSGAKRRLATVLGAT